MACHFHMDPLLFLHYSQSSIQTVVTQIVSFYVVLEFLIYYCLDQGCQNRDLM